MRAVRIANDGQRGSSYNPDAALRPGAATCSAGRPEAHARANHMGTRRRARGLPVASAPAWLYGAAACVLIYFALIAVSDLRGREASGALVKFGDRQGTVVGVIPGSPAERAGVQPGDRVIICAYASYSEQELLNHAPKLVYLNEENKVIRTANTIPVQAA